MIDALSMLSSTAPQRTAKVGKKASAEDLFARVLATEVRKSLPDEALGGEWADVFGPLLDDVLATRIADDMRAAGTKAPHTTATRPAPHAHGPVSAVRQTSGYGDRIHPITGKRTHHDGIDLAARRGTPIPVGKAGVVVRAERAGGYGNLVVVDHGDGLTTRYAHCDALKVVPGQRLAPGDVVGTVGSTGRSTGPHLHFEVHKGDAHVDPSDPAFRDLFPQLAGG